MKLLKEVRDDITGQGAAEYILLFGGVIVIALAALYIYRSYFEGSSSELNASSDVNNMRNLMNLS